MPRFGWQLRWGESDGRPFVGLPNPTLPARPSTRITSLTRQTGHNWKVHEEDRQPTKDDDQRPAQLR